jgi:hypothetical protein
VFRVERRRAEVELEAEKLLSLSETAVRVSTVADSPSARTPTV